MKIRADFVTNSSSSSFIVFNIRNKELAKAAEKFDIPVDTTEQGISGAFEGMEEMGVIGVPSTDSLADWFAKFLDGQQNHLERWFDYSTNDWRDHTEIVNYIKANKKAIDGCTESSFIASWRSVSDGDGSSFSAEARDGETIKTYIIYEDDWDYKKQGTALWEVLRETDNTHELIAFAEENDLVKERKDGNAKEKKAVAKKASGTKIFYPEDLKAYKKAVADLDEKLEKNGVVALDKVIEDFDIDEANSLKLGVLTVLLLGYGLLPDDEKKQWRSVLFDNMNTVAGALRMDAGLLRIGMTLVQAESEELQTTVLALLADALFGSIAEKARDYYKYIIANFPEMKSSLIKAYNLINEEADGVAENAPMTEAEVNRFLAEGYQLVGIDEDDHVISVTVKDITSKPAAKSTAKSKAKPTVKSGNYSFPTMDVPDNRKKILTRKPKKTDKPNRYDLYFRPTFETDKFAAKNAPVFYYYCDKVNPGFSDRQKELLAFADTLTTYFGSVGDELREKAIRHGYMKSAYDMHALRSYVWTSLEWCKTNKKDLDDINLDGMQALCDLIAKQGGTNYDVIAKGRKHIGTPLLVKSEYGITYYSVLTSKLGFTFIRTDEEVKKETHSSSTGDLNELIKLLLELRPHVETMAEYLKGVDRSAMTDGDKAMESVLAAYCTFALAADEPFDVLKGPEALDEAVLDEPLKVPEKAEATILDGKAIMAGTLMIGYLGSGTNLLLPEGIEDILVMDLNIPETNAYHKAEIVTYPKSLTAKSVDIPYNVKKAVFTHDAEEFSAEPQDKSWDDPGKLTSLIYKGTIQNLGGCCWMASQNVTYVELPEGLKSFGRYAFDGAGNLAEITFPETVENYDEKAFDRSNYGSKPLKITAYAGTPSEKLAKELASKSENITCNIVVSPQEQARRAALEAQKREEQRRLAEEQRKLVEEQRRLAEEQRRVLEEQNRLAAEKRAAEINAAIMKLRQERVVQEKIVAENGGLFGEKARNRKAAKEQIASIDAQIAQLERSK